MKQAERDMTVPPRFVQRLMGVFALVLVCGILSWVFGWDVWAWWLMGIASVLIVLAFGLSLVAGGGAGCPTCGYDEKSHSTRVGREQ